MPSTYIRKTTKALGWKSLAWGAAQERVYVRRYDWNSDIADVQRAVDRVYTEMFTSGKEPGSLSRAREPDVHKVRWVVRDGQRLEEEGGEV